MLLEWIIWWVRKLSIASFYGEFLCEHLLCVVLNVSNISLSVLSVFENFVLTNKFRVYTRTQAIFSVFDVCLNYKCCLLAVLVSVENLWPWGAVLSNLLVSTKSWYDDICVCLMPLFWMSFGKSIAGFCRMTVISSSATMQCQLKCSQLVHSCTKNNPIWKTHNSWMTLMASEAFLAGLPLTSCADM